MSGKLFHFVGYQTCCHETASSPDSTAASLIAQQGYRKLKLMSLLGNAGPDLNSCDSWLQLSWRGIALSHGYHLPQLVDGGLPMQAAEAHAFMLAFQGVFQLESWIMGLAMIELSARIQHYGKSGGQRLVPQFASHHLAAASNRPSSKGNAAS
jgi:hypothetical protein